MALVSLPASELPPAPLFASLFYLLHSWSSSSSSLTLSLSRSLTHSCPPLGPSWSVVTLFRRGKKGGWEEVSRESGLYFSPSQKLPSPQMILVSPSSRTHVHTHTHTHTHTHSIHWPPPRLPRVAYLTSPPLHLSSCRACSLMSALMSLQFFIGSPFLFPDLLLQKISAGLDSRAAE